MQPWPGPVRVGARERPAVPATTVRFQGVMPIASNDRRPTVVVEGRRRFVRPVQRD